MPLAISATEGVDDASEQACARDVRVSTGSGFRGDHMRRSLIGLGAVLLGTLAAMAHDVARMKMRLRYTAGINSGFGAQ